MKKASTLAALVTAALAGFPAGSTWSHEVTPDTAAPGNQAQPGWYPPPPPNARGYAQPWQQRSHWPAPPRGYGQLPTPYPPRGQYRPVPGAPVAVENPLSAELKYTQEQLTAKSTELGKVNATLEQLRVILQQRLEAEITLNEKVAAITSEQQALQARVTELTTELNTTTAALEQNRQQATDHQQQTRELTAERDQLRGDLANRDEQLATLRGELRSTAQAFEQARSRVTSSSQQLSDAGAQAEALKNERMELLAQLEDSKAVLQASEQTLAGAIAERDKLQADLAARSAELTQVQTSLDAAPSAQSLADAIAERDKLQADLAARSTELAQVQATLDAAPSAQSLADAIAERDKLQADLAARSTELAQVQAALDAAPSAQSLADAIAERDKLQADLAARSAELAQVQAASDATVVVMTPTAAAEAEENLEVAAVEIGALQTTELDADGDSIPDSADLCGETQQGIAVDATGCAEGVAINLQGVNFLYDSHELTPEAQRILDRVADILSQQPDLRLEVAGHTDAQGDPAYNQWLSLKRAEAVRDYIVAKGVNPGHIGAGGYGGQRPIADNATKEGLRMNRRVELRRLQ